VNESIENGSPHSLNWPQFGNKVNEKNKKKPNDDFKYVHNRWEFCEKKSICELEKKNAIFTQNLKRM
jgi:hypothetical protein